jgi:hypothetical protein
MSRLCVAGLIVCGVVYLAALVAATIGTPGHFGVPTDGLAAVWLIFVGLPLSLATSLSAIAGVPDAVAMVLTALAPLANVGVIWWICRGKPF